MTKVDLKGKTSEDLKKEILEHEVELRKLRFNVAGTKGLKTNARTLRKDIARAKTELVARSK